MEKDKNSFSLSEPDDTVPDKGVRINKFLSDAGLSRRKPTGTFWRAGGD